MPRLTLRSPAERVLFAVVFGVFGAGLLWLGLAERIGWLVTVGVTFAGTALGMAVIVIGRTVRAVVRRSREVGVRRYRAHRHVLRPLALGSSVLLGLAAILVTYNYVVWARIERDCELALEAVSVSEAELAFRRGMAAMEDPLLVIPSDLFDLWGPNRCRNAAERFETR